MASRLGKRVVYLANLPIRLLMPNSCSNITEIAIKTIPSASKFEIKRVLESLYGFEVDTVHTLNMEGKKKKRGGVLLAKPDYKKAYVTLKNPLSISPHLYPIPLIEEEKQRIKRSVSGVAMDGEAPSHWLDDQGPKFVPRYHGIHHGHRCTQSRRLPESDRDRDRGRGRPRTGQEKFPWSTMRPSR